MLSANHQLLTSLPPHPFWKVPWSHCSGTLPHTGCIPYHPSLPQQFMTYSCKNLSCWTVCSLNARLLAYCTGFHSAQGHSRCSIHIQWIMKKAWQESNFPTSLLFNAIYLLKESSMVLTGSQDWEPLIYHQQETTHFPPSLTDSLLPDAIYP